MGASARHAKACHAIAVFGCPYLAPFQGLEPLIGRNNKGSGIIGVWLFWLFISFARLMADHLEGIACIERRLLYVKHVITL
jgi:hypothetical protein